MIDVAGRIRTLLNKRAGALPEMVVETYCRQRCACGAEVNVVRESRGRHVECPKCGAALFVFAASRWPQPRPPRGAEPIEWEPGGNVAAPPVVTVPPIQAETPASAAIDDAPPAEPQPTLAEIPERVQAAVTEHVRRRPLWWIALGAVVLIAATSFWSWRAARRREAAAELGHLTTTGNTALIDGDYAKAAELLAAAAQAARDLPGDTPAERRALQLDREAQIWSRMAQLEPAEFFLSRARGSRDDARGRWPAEFKAIFANQAVVFDAWVRREIDVDWAQMSAAEPSPAGEPTAQPLEAPRLRMDWALVAPPLRLEVVLPDDKAFERIQAGDPQRVVFGAQLAGIRPATGNPNVWLVDLVPGSCVPLTVDAPLARHGWPSDAESHEILSRQANAQAVTP